MERYTTRVLSLSTPSTDLGEPVDRPVVTVYDVGTLNPATIFSDNLAAPTPLANPFTATTLGLAQFYAANGRYDVALSNGPDTSPLIATPYTIGDVSLGLGDSGVPSYPFANLPASGSAANAGRLARVTDMLRGLWMDTGALWFSIVQETVNVREFGAVGDGVVDDTAACQAAIDAAAAEPIAIGHPPVWFPRGTYSVTALTIPTTGMSLWGTGYRRRTTIIQGDPGAATSLITCDVSSGEQKGPTIRGLFLQGHDTNGLHVLHLTGSKGAILEELILSGPGPNGACLRINSSSRSINVRNIRIQNRNTVAGTRGLWIGDAADPDPLTSSIWIDNLMMYNIAVSERLTDHVIFLDNAGAVQIGNSKLDGVASPVALQITQGGNHRFTNVGFEVPGTIPTVIDINTAQSVDFVGCAIAANATTALNVVASSAIRWRGGKLRNAVVIDSASHDVSFKDGVYQSSGPAAVTIADAGNNTIWRGMRAITSSDVILTRILTNETPQPLWFQRYDESGANDIADGELLYVAGGSATAPIQAITFPYGGVVVAVTVRTSVARTAGTLTITPRKNGASMPSLIRVDLDAANPTAASVTQQDFDSATLQFAPGDVLDVGTGLAGGYAPVTAALQVGVWVARRGTPGSPS